MATKHFRRAALAGALATLNASVLLHGNQGSAQATPASRASEEITPEETLLGEWWTDNNEGRILFTKAEDGTFRGTTTCCVPKVSTPDHPAYDIHNPDPKLRGRSTVGIVLIWKLAFEEGEYSGGYVYNPRNGKTYRFSAQIIDQDTVKIRGYMGIPLLGQSQTWKRAKAP